MITQNELLERYEYDVDTGALYNKETLSSRAREGVRAGSVHKSNGYRNIRIRGKVYKEHRVIWAFVTGAFPVGQIDHVNGDITDNRMSNLRDVTQTENQHNRKLGKDNTSGFMGVYATENGTWAAKIKVLNKSIHLGTFKEIEGAIAARAAANIKYDYHENHGMRC